MKFTTLETITTTKEIEWTTSDELLDTYRIGCLFNRGYFANLLNSMVTSPLGIDDCIVNLKKETINMFGVKNLSDIPYGQVEVFYELLKDKINDYILDKHIQRKDVILKDFNKYCKRFELVMSNTEKLLKKLAFTDKESMDIILRHLSYSEVKKAIATNNFKPVELQVNNVIKAAKLQNRVKLLLK